MEITGQIRISPPLTPEETVYLTRFTGTSRMARTQGPYFVDGTGPAGEDKGPYIIDYNSPPSGQPSLWCGWKPTFDGTALVWDGMETFHYPVEWMRYLIDHFLRSDAHAAADTGPHRPEAFDRFTFDHTLSGRVEITGPDGQRWDLLVDNNEVSAIDRSGRGVPQQSESDRWEIELRAAPYPGVFLDVVRRCLEQSRSLDIPWSVRSAAADRATALGLPLDSHVLAARLDSDPEQDTDALLDVLILALGEQRADLVWNSAVAEVDHGAATEDAQIKFAVALSRAQTQIRIAQEQLSRLTEGDAWNANYAEGELGEDLAQLLDQTGRCIRLADALDRTVRTSSITAAAAQAIQQGPTT